MLKFIVMSDLHIVPEGQVSHGLDTMARLDQAIAHIMARHRDADFCILAGDLADRGARAAYERIRGALPALRLPQHLTLGNHDDAACFREVFPDVPVAETGKYDTVIDAKGYRVILLDSTEPGRPEGALTEAQIAWLEARLAEAADRPVIAVLHHNVTDFGVPTDRFRLQNSARFLDTLAGHGDVRQVISGHVHMTVSGYARGLPFTTICGNHYNILPWLDADLSEVPRTEGPGQIGVVLADAVSVVVHHESFLDHNIVQDQSLHKWD